MLEFLQDFWGFLRVRKKFWLLPILLALLLLSGLIIFSQSATVMMIYTVF